MNISYIYFSLKTVKETASLRVDTNLPQTQFRVEELVRSRQNVSKLYGSRDALMS